MFKTIKTFASAHETAVTATLAVAAAVVASVIVVKLDTIQNPEDYNTQA